jgi:hypothetical protein
MRLRSKTILYEVRLRTDGRGVDLISDALPFGRLWYGEPNAVANAIGYAKHYSRQLSPHQRLLSTSAHRADRICVSSLLKKAPRRLPLYSCAQ